MKEFLSILKDTRKHLMNGVSYMIPVVVGGGVLMALAMILNGGQATAPEAGFAGGLWTIGAALLGLMVPVLSAYIAFSIADRAGIAPGLVGGMLAANLGAGFLGGLISGILAGIVCYYLKKIPLPTSLKSLGSIIIIPIVGSFAVGAVMYWVVGAPMASIMEGLTSWLTTMTEGNKIILGIIMGCMLAFDMGGPVNKVAYSFMVATVGTGIYTFAGPAAIGICIPPLGMALATFLAPKKYTAEERDAGKAAIAMGCVGITEGAIPFAANDPLRVIPSLMAGSATGCAIAYALNVTNKAAWGGLIVLPVVGNIAGFLLATAIGTIVTAVLVNLLKKNAVEKTDAERDNAEVDISFE